MASRLGSPNKTTGRVALTCQIKGYDSIEAMIDAAQIALEKFVEHSQKETSGQWSPMESKAADYLKLYVKIATDMANYVYPKRRAVELSTVDAMAGMTPVQRLEAMKQAVKMLEMQLGGSSMVEQSPVKTEAVGSSPTLPAKQDG